MIPLRRLALAALLALLPLPLSSLAALAQQAPGEGDETAGMAARPHFVVEAGVRVPAAAPSTVATRLALPMGQLTAPPRPVAWHGAPPAPALPQTPGVRLALLGRLLLDGG